MTRPTGLRLLVPHWFLDVDAAVPTHARIPVAVTRWLPVPGREPLLVEELRGPGEFGPVRVDTRSEPRLPGHAAGGAPDRADAGHGRRIA